MSEFLWAVAEAPFWFIGAAIILAAWLLVIAIAWIAFCYVRDWLTATWVRRSVRRSVRIARHNILAARAKGGDADG